MEMSQNYIQVVEKEALMAGVDPDLAVAIAAVESSWDPWATRFESGWKYFYKVPEFAQANLITVQTEATLQALSWGLMQIMGSVARERGFSGELPRLCLAELGAKYGCLQIKWLMGRYSEEDDVIAAYNQGNNRKDASGIRYNNQPYVDKVKNILQELRFVSGNLGRS